MGINICKGEGEIFHFLFSRDKKTTKKKRWLVGYFSLILIRGRRPFLKKLFFFLGIFGVLP